MMPTARIAPYCFIRAVTLIEMLFTIFSTVTVDSINVVSEKTDQTISFSYELRKGKGIIQISEGMLL